jgi:hypothetical protein
VKDEKAIAEAVSEIIASDDANVYELRGDDADSFLNLLQEVRKLSFLSRSFSKCVVYGSFGTVPSL